MRKRYANAALRRRPSDHREASRKWCRSFVSSPIRHYGVDEPGRDEITDVQNTWRGILRTIGYDTCRELGGFDNRNTLDLIAVGKSDRQPDEVGHHKKRGQ